MSKNFFYATATLIGTIVGAGMFGIPYVVAQSGFLIGAIFLFVLTIITLLIHLIWGEIVCRTKEKHRLVGYAEKYLGKQGKIIVTLSTLFGLFGAMLVYLIISGEFLFTIFSPILGGTPFIYSLVFYAFGAIIIFEGLKLIKKLEFFIAPFLILIVILIFALGLKHVEISNLTTINLKYFFLPYGVILWALAGGSAVPEIKAILGANEKYYKKTILIGTIIPAILYGLFAFTIVGISGTNTSSEAINGLAGYFGKGIIILGAVFGILAVVTSFVVLGYYLKKVFQYDYKRSKTLSWFLTCSIPLIAFLIGLRSIIPIIAFLGVILGAIEGTAVILIYKKAKKIGDQEPEYSLKIPNFIIYSLIGIFVLGLIYEIIYFVK